MGMNTEEILDYLPQKPPFRFIDKIHKVNDEEIEASYTFKADEFFYKGHFPGNPITPGVILLEAMAQTGVVAYGIYLSSQTMTIEEMNQYLTVFTDANVEFSDIVRPGEKITVSAKKQFFRRFKLKVDVKLVKENGAIACSGTISGMGVKQT
jgi:3-hydroxyacyl-[acyl-carrier-protein] dehydratase